MGVGRRGWTLDAHGWSLALSPEEERLVMSVDSVLQRERLGPASPCFSGLYFTVEMQLPCLLATDTEFFLFSWSACWERDAEVGLGQSLCPASLEPGVPCISPVTRPRAVGPSPSDVATLVPDAVFRAAAASALAARGLPPGSAPAKDPSQGGWSGSPGTRA